ncbi:MAG: LytTR family transcriptional regulator DNA-binding domain-containing protein [Asticcacaulis sp.]|nr:LytTR family transcriptional regulator DNA-binding domain-containing protein [Asticcacaulis sp.]
MRIRDWRGEGGDRGWWLRALAFALVLGVIFGVLGPFGSFLNGDVPMRIVSWTGNMVTGTLIYGLLAPPMTRRLMRAGLPILAAFSAAVVVLTLPGAILAALWGNWLWPQAVARVRPIDWYVQSLIIATGVLVLWVLIELARENLKQAPPPSSAPADRAEPVLCLQMEDHYVRVHRVSGSRLELMTLSQAMTRYGGDGLQVHRSWWVAAAAFAGAERDGRNWRLRLVNGVTVPVARNRVIEARARGWIVEPD